MALRFGTEVCPSRERYVDMELSLLCGLGLFARRPYIFFPQHVAHIAFAFALFYACSNEETQEERCTDRANNQTDDESCEHRLDLLSREAISKIWGDWRESDPRRTLLRRQPLFPAELQPHERTSFRSSKNDTRRTCERYKQYCLWRIVISINGADDRIRTYSRLITGELRYRCATSASWSGWP